MNSTLNKIEKEKLHPAQLAKKVLQMVDYFPLKKGQSFVRDKSTFKSAKPQPLTLKKRATINNLIDNFDKPDQIKGAFSEIVRMSLQTLSCQFDQVPEKARKEYVTAFIAHLAKDFAKKWPEKKINGTCNNNLEKDLKESAYDAISPHHYKEKHRMTDEEDEEEEEGEEEEEKKTRGLIHPDTFLLSQNELLPQPPKENEKHRNNLHDGWADYVPPPPPPNYNYPQLSDMNLRPPPPNGRRHYGNPSMLQFPYPQVRNEFLRKQLEQEKLRQKILRASNNTSQPSNRKGKP